MAEEGKELLAQGGPYKMQSPLDNVAASLQALAQAIEHQAAAIAALVEEMAAQAEEGPQDDAIPQAMSRKR